MLRGYRSSFLHCSCYSLCQWGIISLEDPWGCPPTHYTGIEMKAVTQLAVISLLFLLVTTHILTSPFFSEAHWNIRRHVQLSTSQVASGFPCISAKAAWFGFIPTAGLVVLVCVTGFIFVYICLCFCSVCCCIRSVCFWRKDYSWGYSAPPPAPSTLPLQSWTGSKSCTGLPWQQQLSID